MPVSEPEKHAERMMRTTRAAIRMLKGTSLKRGNPSRSAGRYYGGAVRVLSSHASRSCVSVTHRDTVVRRDTAQTGRYAEYQRRSSSTSRIQRLPK